MLGVLLYLPSSFLPGPCLTCYRSPKFWDHLDLNEHVSLPSCLFWQVTLDSMLSLSGFPPLAGVAMCLPARPSRCVPKLRVFVLGESPGISSLVIKRYISRITAQVTATPDAQR